MQLGMQFLQSSMQSSAIVVHPSICLSLFTSRFFDTTTEQNIFDQKVWNFTHVQKFHTSIGAPPYHAYKKILNNRWLYIQFQDGHQNIVLSSSWRLLNMFKLQTLNLVPTPRVQKRYLLYFAPQMAQLLLSSCLYTIAWTGTAFSHCRIRTHAVSLNMLNPLTLLIQC